MTDQIEVTIRVTNIYPSVGEHLEHVLTVKADAPSGDALDTEEGRQDWIENEFFQYTGEGGDYADLHGSCTVEILDIAKDYRQFIGLQYGAEG